MSGPGIQPRALLVGASRSRAALAAALEAEGFTVVPAANDTEAYKALLAGTPALLVADVTRDNLLSREALLVGMLANPLRPPFVAVAAEDGAKSAAALVQRGALCSLRDPVDTAEACAVFRRAFEARSKERDRTLLLGDLDAMRELVHDAFLNLLDGVLIVDSSGVVQFANDEAARLLLQKREALVSSRVDPTLGSDLYALLKAARDASDRRSQKEFEIMSGTERLKVLGKASIVHDHAGKPVGGLLVLRNLDPKRAGGFAPAAPSAVTPPVAAPAARAAPTTASLSNSIILGAASASPPAALTGPKPTATMPRPPTPAAMPRPAAPAPPTPRSVPRPSPQTPPNPTPRQPTKTDDAKVASILDALRKKTTQFQTPKNPDGEPPKEKP